MLLNTAEIQRLARLARIQISAGEIEDYRQQLNRLLHYMEVLQSVDTRNINAMTHPQAQPLRLREDAVTADNSQQALLSLAPQATDGLYIVPRVVA